MVTDGQLVSDEVRASPGGAVISATGYWVKAPLVRPYGLSFGTLEEFDLVLVRLVDESGRVGFGESCPVPPYSPETAAEVWAAVQSTLPALVGREPGELVAGLVTRGDGPAGFSFVACTTALEALLDPPQSEAELLVPIVGTVQAVDEAGLDAEIARLVGLGHRTVKVKVGFEPADDLRRVGMIRRLAPAGVRLRLDANEAWDLEQARRFLGGLDPEGIDLLEQPLSRDRWEDFEVLAAEYPQVALMLDESVGSKESVRRAAEVGATVVKFKLMKAGSRQVLRRRISQARELGLSVVVGNGVAGVVDNWYEASSSREADRPGEMNGSLKLSDGIIDERPDVVDGRLRFPAGFSLRVDVSDLQRRSHQIVRG